jgi:hypothetical protein
MSALLDEQGNRGGETVGGGQGDYTSLGEPIRAPRRR